MKTKINNTYRVLESMCIDNSTKIEDLEKQCSWLFHCLLVFTILNLVNLGCLIMLLFK